MCIRVYNFSEKVATTVNLKLNKPYLECDEKSVFVAPKTYKDVQFVFDSTKVPEFRKAQVYIVTGVSDLFGASTPLAFEMRVGEVGISRD
ncbi:MAG: hypothetical protein A2Y07_10655 [Planctomycetes bacterium GWF2_50_10]|nr:MAG: hypothetical protein A2Y07_10655 [Planctomycetes bacterium GWF2_50_10]